MSTVVISIGNIDRGDDAVGPSVMTRLKCVVGADTRLVVTDPSRVMDEIGGADRVIVVDACKGLGKCGAVRVLDTFPPEYHPPSTHGISITMAMELARMLGHSPPSVRYVLVEGAVYGYGETMSPLVRKAIPTAVKAVLRELKIDRMSYDARLDDIPMTGHELVILLRKAGWTPRRKNGNHEVMRRAGRTLVIPIYDGEDLRPRTQSSILRWGGTEMKNGYMVVYYPDGDGWGAEVPDLPGCLTCGATLEEVRSRVKEAIHGWIEVARLEGDPIPEPSRIVETVSVEVPVN